VFAAKLAYRHPGTPTYRVTDTCTWCRHEAAPIEVPQDERDGEDQAAALLPDARSERDLQCRAPTKPTQGRQMHSADSVSRLSITGSSAAGSHWRHCC